MTRSLRLSALLLLLLSRWASADLEKGEDEFVRSWVIIEEQLVPPSRDEPLQAAVGGGVAAGGASAGRRITPKSVFVAPSFNKCSDNYRPDSMGRCVKVVKLNQAAQWDFLLKQLNSMYGPGGGGGSGGFQMSPVAAPVYRPPFASMITTTVEPPSQKTDSPGPFQLNIPFAGHADSSYKPAAPAESFSDERLAVATASTTTASAVSTTVTVTDDVTVTDNPAAGTTIKPASAATGTAIDPESEDDADIVTTEDVETTTTMVNKLRPYRDRYQTTTQHAEDDTEANTFTTPDDSPLFPTTAPTDVKSKFVDKASTTTVTPAKTAKPAEMEALPSSSASPPTVVTTTATADDAETEEPVTGAPTAATTTEPADEEDVITVLAVAAQADGSVVGRPTSSTRMPPHAAAVDDKKTRPKVPDVVSPEYYDDQPEEQTVASEPNCSLPNAHRYYAACADAQQQQIQQMQQIQQQQLLLQQHQQQQQFYQQQQQQQFYQQQQQQLLLQQQHLQQQQPQNNNLVTNPVVKRPAAGGGVQVRFPEDGDVASENASPVRFPGSAPYRTTNKMYESSRHPMWWPTGWPEQQQAQQQSQLQQQQQKQPQSLQEPQSHSDEDTIYQQHRLQHHLPQQKQDVRLREFGLRLPKISSTTTVLPPSPPSPSTQWFHRFF